MDSQLDSQENQYISQFLNLDEKLMIDKSKFDWVKYLNESKKLNI